MTQSSFPWAGVAPGSGADAGRYTALQWWGIWASLARSAGLITDSATTLLRTLAALTNLGVFYSVGNQLEVTNPGAAANTIQINTGASIVEGGFYYNNVAVTFNVPINRTNDLIVVRKNYSSSTYTPPANTDPNELVPPYTTRVTRVTPAGFEQDTSRATYWDVPLADFTTDGVGAVTINSDDREYVDAETKYAWADFHSAYNDTDSADIVQDSVRGFKTIAAKDSTAYASWRVPQDYISGMSALAVVITIANGDIRISNNARYSACDEDYEINRSRFIEATVAGLASGIRECIAETTLDGNWMGNPVEAGEMVNFSAVRRGTDGADTLTDVYYVGEKIEYLGWK